MSWAQASFLGFNMCLGIPAVVLDVDYSKMTATIDYGDGVPRSVLVGISEDRVRRGDIVIVHAGTIVSRMGVEDLLEQIKFFEEVLGDSIDPSIIAYYSSLLERAKSLQDSSREVG